MSGLGGKQRSKATEPGSGRLRPSRLDMLLAVIAAAIFSLDLLLPPGRAIIVLLILVVILSGRARSPRRVCVWTAICAALVVSGYVIRHHCTPNSVWLVRRGICLLGLAAACGVILRNHWLEAVRRQRAELLEQVPAAIFVRDARGRISSWSKGAELLYGWPAADILGRNLAEMGMAPGAAARPAAGRWQGEARRRTSDGRWIDILYRCAVRRDEAGEIVLVLESDTDISAHKAQEAAIGRSELHFRRIFQTAGAAIWEEDYTGAKALIDALKAAGVTDLPGFFRTHPEQVREVLGAVEVIAANRATSALLRAGDAPLAGVKGALLLRAEAGCLAGFLAHAVQGRASYTAETTLALADGEPRSVQLSASFFNWAGAAPSVLLSAVDVTERQRAERALIGSRERLAALSRTAALGQLAALIGGDLAEPMRRIHADSQRAEALLRAGRPVDELLRRIIETARQGAGSVGDVQSFLKRGQSGGEGIALPAVIGAAMGLIERRLSLSAVTLQIEIADGLPEIADRAGWLEHVVLHALVSCIQAMPLGEDSRTLRLGVARDGGDIVLRFQSGTAGPEPDTTCAEAAGQLAPVAEDAGLAICRASVEAQGGRMLVAQRPAGLRIDVMFPLQSLAMS